jgi:hypothetical protein
MIKKIIIYQNDKILSMISREPDNILDICSILIREELKNNFVNKIIIKKLERVFYILVENDIKILIETKEFYPPLVIKLIIHDLSIKLKNYYHGNIVTDTIVTFQWITDIFDNAQCPIKYNKIYNINRIHVKDIYELPFDEEKINSLLKNSCILS